jgi:hypothetical protein
MGMRGQWDLELPPSKYWTFCFTECELWGRLRLLNRIELAGDNGLIQIKSNQIILFNGTARYTNMNYMSIKYVSHL